MPEDNPLTAREKLTVLCHALVDAKALDIVVLEVTDITILADYFVVATATSSVHGNAIGRGVRQELKQGHGLRCIPEGDQESDWIVMDYGDVIAHVMSPKLREFYSLEKLWGKAKQWRWRPDGPNQGGVKAGDDE